MKEIMYEKEYNNILKERENFYKIYNIIKTTALEIQNNLEEKDIISYFCIVSNSDRVYITFYSEDGRDLIQILTTQNNKNFFELFDKEIIRETNVEKTENDGFFYRAYIFNYNEEPYFIKQIILNNKSFEETDLIKEIDAEIEYYKDKIQKERKEIFDYTKTNNILNKYKFEN